jgi:branched-chain amino acid transport system permease protein
MTTSDANTAANTAPSEETGATPPAPAAIVQKKQSPWRAPLAFLAMGLLLVLVGAFQSWSVALAILNMSLISALMAMGLNLQWGYAGLFNAGVMAFTALGGLAAVVVSHPPVWTALAAGGRSMALSGVILIATIATVVFAGSAFKGAFSQIRHLRRHRCRLRAAQAGLHRRGDAIEAVDPARPASSAGSACRSSSPGWPAACFAAAVAWLIGKVSLGLRSDYLAIATLGISEIVIAVLKNEDWLARGVKNVTGLARPLPVPYEIELQQKQWFIDLVSRFHAATLDAAPDAAAREALLRQMLIEGASAYVKIAYAILFTVVLLIILALCVRALNSPWGRMMRAIRDNEEAAAAMGKDIKARHLQVFVLGSAIIGIAGAMMTTLDGQFT